MIDIRCVMANENHFTAANECVPKYQALLFKPSASRCAGVNVMRLMTQLLAGSEVVLRYSHHAGQSGFPQVIRAGHSDLTPWRNSVKHA